MRPSEPPRDADAVNGDGSRPGSRDYSGHTAGDGLHLKAHAKVNLGLAVLGRRPDGFHEIDSLFARIDLHDEIWLRPARELSGELVSAPDELVSGSAELAMDESNLAVRAARLYLDEAKIASAVSVRLLKRIPLAAGLGGGSSDAAAVLLGMRRLFPAHVDVKSLAQRLGSDVPFFLEAARCARGSGRGERLEAVALPAVPIVVVKPHRQMPAAAAYRAVRSFGPRLDAQRITEALAAGSEPGWRNDLQPGVVASCPEVGRVLEALAGSGLRGALMSGSGTSCFAVAGGEAEARSAARRLAREHPDWFVWNGWAARPGGQAAG